MRGCSGFGAVDFTVGSAVSINSSSGAVQTARISATVLDLLM
jgi:hypothetical protein